MARSPSNNVFVDMIACGDSRRLFKHPWFPEVDLVFTSPPYEDARTYGGRCKVRAGEEWVKWAVRHFTAQLRVCRGLVAWVIQGRTRNYQWSLTPFLLAAELHNRGVPLRRPVIFHRSGIPGSGGPDWLRNDHEYVLCATREGGPLPWADPTACGHPPKYGPGGDPTHRKRDGTRVRQTFPDSKWHRRDKRIKNDLTGEHELQVYKPPKLANPGDVVRCPGGHLGDKLAHEHPSPFPEKLADFFIRSFCPPGGIVLDPFCGSGTTCAVAKKLGRRYIGIDVVRAYCDLAERRLQEINP